MTKTCEKVLPEMVALSSKKAVRRHDGVDRKSSCVNVPVSQTVLISCIRKSISAKKVIHISLTHTAQYRESEGALR